MFITITCMHILLSSSRLTTPGNTGRGFLGRGALREPETRLPDVPETKTKIIMP